MASRNIRAALQALHGGECLMRHANTENAVATVCGSENSGRGSNSGQPGAFRQLPPAAACFSVRHLFIGSPLVRTSCSLMLRIVD